MSKVDIERGIIKKRNELDDIMSWFKKEVSLTEKNIAMIIRLLDSKIICMSHEIHLNYGKINGLVQHNNREDMREYLKEYVRDKLNNAGGKNG